MVVSSIDEGLFVLQPTGLARLNTGASANNNLPASFTLSSAYPNPFHNATSFTLALGLPLPVRLSAYDVLGREVALIHDSTLPAGSYTFHFVAEGLPTGKYFVRATAQSIERTLTVTLVKRSAFKAKASPQ